MACDVEKAKELVLALMWLGIHETHRTWKSFDWTIMDALHDDGLITDPKSKAKSVVLSEEGMARSLAMYRKHLDPAA
jgi:hypothetical protein